MDVAEARAVLGVGADDPWPAVRSAYRRRIRAVHPDLNGGAAAAAARLNEAYAVLSRARRAGGRGAPPPGPTPAAPDPAPPAPPPPADRRRGPGRQRHAALVLPAGRGLRPAARRRAPRRLGQLRRPGLRHLRGRRPPGRRGLLGGRDPPGPGPRHRGVRDPRGAGPPGDPRPRPGRRPAPRRAALTAGAACRGAW